jgi:hypothetical protein
MRKLMRITTIALLILALVTQVLKIYVANTTALDSIAASKIATEINQIIESNMELRGEVLMLSSYQNVASKAAELGYKDTSELISVYDPVKVAVSR